MKQNLSISEFLEVLQKEYICAEVRSKIFKKKYKQYWVRAMSGKREKIEDICAKNRLTSIFHSREEYHRVYQEVIPEWGEPDFCYRDSEQKRKLEKWDRVFFYNRNTEIKILNEDNSSSIGEIMDNSMCLNEFPVLLVRVKNTEKNFLAPLKRVSRIL